MEAMNTILGRGNARIEDFNTISELQEYFADENLKTLLRDGELSEEEIDMAREDAMMYWKDLD